MAKVFGDLGKRDSFIQHVGGVAVAQGVDDDAFVSLEQAGGGEGDLEGKPRGGCRHVAVTFSEMSAQGVAGAFPVPAGSGKEPLRILMPLPKGAKTLEDFYADGNLAWLTTLAFFDPEDEAVAVDVFGLRCEGLEKA